MLNNLGLTADIANNGYEAVTALKAATKVKPYTMVIMDCNMPKMDGYETTAKIRAGDAGREVISIPIIAMTANAMQGDKERCLNAGMDDYLAKPIEANAVLETLKHWLIDSEKRPVSPQDMV